MLQARITGYSHVKNATRSRPTSTEIVTAGASRAMENEFALSCSCEA